MSLFDIPLVNYVISIIAASVSFTHGFKAVFYPQKAIDRVLKTHDSEFVKRQVHKKWYRANLKITGSVAMLFGVVVFIYIISVIIKKNWVN